MPMPVTLAKSATPGRVLPDLSQPAPKAIADMSRDELLAIIASLKAAPSRAVTCKVSDKGALSIYGLGRFPITLYISQYDKLVQSWDTISAFVEANRSRFATKE